MSNKYLSVFTLLLIFVSGCDKWEKLPTELIKSDKMSNLKIDFSAALFNDSKFIFYMKSNEGFEIILDEMSLINSDEEILFLPEIISDYELELTEYSNKEISIAFTGRELVKWFLDEDPEGFVSIPFQQGDSLYIHKYKVMSND